MNQWIYRFLNELFSIIFLRLGYKPLKTKYQWISDNILNFYVNEINNARETLYWHHFILFKLQWISTKFCIQKFCNVFQELCFPECTRKHLESNYVQLSSVLNLGVFLTRNSDFKIQYTSLNRWPNFFMFTLLPMFLSFIKAYVGCAPMPDDTMGQRERLV